MPQATNCIHHRFRPASGNSAEASAGRYLDTADADLRVWPQIFFRTAVIDGNLITVRAIIADYALEQPESRLTSIDFDHHPEVFTSRRSAFLNADHGHL